MGQGRVLAKVMAVKAVPPAKGACFGFSKVETSSEHEQATSWEMECQCALRPKSNKDLVKCLMNLSSRCGEFQYATYCIRLLGRKCKIKSC